MLIYSYKIVLIFKFLLCENRQLCSYEVKKKLRIKDSKRYTLKRVTVGWTNIFVLDLSAIMTLFMVQVNINHYLCFKLNLLGIYIDYAIKSLGLFWGQKVQQIRCMYCTRPTWVLSLIFHLFPEYGQK